MGLSGNLEDMPLQDILQIIHHSKKSGTLYISGPPGEGTIVFRDGTIVQSFSPTGRIDIGDGLLERGRITRDTLKEALEIQNQDARGQRLGSILIERGAVRFEDIEEVVKGQIQSAVNELLTWTAGSFNLVLEEVPDYDTIAVALDELALPKGLDAQHLLLEALRTWDEQARDAGNVPEPTVPTSTAPGPNAAAGALEQDEGEVPPAVTDDGVPISLASQESEVSRDEALLNPLVVVVPDQELAARIFDYFRDLGFPVETTSDPADALDLLPLFCTGDLRPTVVMDALAADDVSLTPVALVEGFRKKIPNLPIVVLMEKTSAEQTSSFYRTGVRNVVRKPTDDGEVTGFLTELAGILAGLIADRRTPPPPEPPAEPPSELAPDVEDFQRQIDELRSQRETAAMTLSLLRIISRRFDRAIFFYVRDDETLVPLGAFGSTDGDESVAVVVREHVVPIEPASAMHMALTAGSITTVRPSSDLSSVLVERIGLPRRDEACLLPLVTAGRTVAILYCDQGQSDETLGQLDSFSPLLAQAARTLDQVLSSQIP